MDAKLQTIFVDVEKVESVAASDFADFFAAFKGGHFI